MTALVGPGFVSGFLTALVVGSIFILVRSVVRRRGERRKPDRDPVLALAESEARMVAIMGTAPDGIITIDTQGTIESANPAAGEIFGYAPFELTGQNISILMPEPHASRLGEYLAKLREDHEAGTVRLSREVMGKHRDGTVFPAELAVSEFELDGKRIFTGIVRDVSERKKRELENQRLKTAVEQAQETILVTDTKGRIQYANPAFERTTGHPRESVLGKNPRILQSGKQDAEFYRELWETILRGETWCGRFVNRRKDGTLYHEDATISPVKNEAGEITNFVSVNRDITEQVAIENQLLQAQKLESIGQLAAGIAHEINTPTQYVGDNTRFLQESFEGILGVLEKAAELVAAIGEDGAAPELASAVSQMMEDADVEYLREEIPRAITESLEGVSRVSKIVGAMKSFSHPGVEGRTSIDLNAAIQSTVTVATNEWKYVAEVEMDLEESLPSVCCYPGEVNQVILNLVINAAHALGDKLGDSFEQKGTIRVTTRKDGDWVEIRVSDTGCGMPEEIRDKVFDQFFTTKAVGKGTGQGLSIAHGVVVQKHGGEISFETEVGEGTTFIIRLPFAPSSEQLEEAEK